MVEINEHKLVHWLYVKEGQQRNYYFVGLLTYIVPDITLCIKYFIKINLIILIK